MGCEATSWVTAWDSSRATTTFCWLPPDKVPTGVSTELARISNSVSLCSPVPLYDAQPPGTEVGVGGLVVDVEHEVVGDRHGQDEPIDLAVFRDVGDPGP